MFTAGAYGTVTALQRDGGFESYRGALVADARAVIRIATPRGGALGLFAGPDPDGDRTLAIGDRLLGSTVTDLAANPVSMNAGRQVCVTPLTPIGPNPQAIPTLLSAGSQVSLAQRT